MAALLQASHISKTFRQPDGQSLIAVKDVSLDLQSGEIVCLVGASGSGKTTLLRILAGTDVPSIGTVTSDIQRPGSQFGYLSQSDRLLPWRSVLSNVALGLEFLGENKGTIQNAAFKALQNVGMEDFANSQPSQLSGGMKQRVLMARMLALQPRLLLLDEPTSSLDVLARRELASLIKNYTRAQQAATLVVTHSVEEACFVADRILLVTRSPATLFKEIQLSDNGGNGIPRSEALNSVMHDLWSALEVAA